MKKLNTLVTLLLLSGFIFISCSKDDDNADPGNGDDPPSGNMLTANINGTDWNASLAVVASSDPGIVTITGSDSNAGQLMFSIFNPTGVGTYSLGGSLTNQNMGRWTQGLGQNDTYTTLLGQGTGTVTISEMTESGFNGTFEFTAKNGAQTEVVINSGEFNASFSSK